MASRIHTIKATVYAVPLCWPWFHAINEISPSIPLGAVHVASRIRRMDEPGHRMDGEKMHHIQIGWCGSEADLRAELVKRAEQERFENWVLGLCLRGGSPAALQGP